MLRVLKHIEVHCFGTSCYVQAFSGSLCFLELDILLFRATSRQYLTTVVLLLFIPAHPPHLFTHAEILGALLSILTIWLVTGVLVYLAVERLISDDYTIEGTVMLITSGCAVLANIV